MSSSVELQESAVAELERQARRQPDVTKELDEVEHRTRAFLAGRIDHREFTPFRVAHGIYSQKQSGAQMVRIKVPAGVLTAGQLDAVADITEKYSSHPQIHITTRQALQLYYVKLADVPKIARELAAVGLTTRGSGGNVVRTVKCCPMAGLHPAAPFHPTPYALAVQERFVGGDEVIALRDGQPKTFFTLPRKFKITFSGCCGDVDCGQASINDIGLLAKTRLMDGIAVNGFELRVGGGLSSQPRNARTLVDFVPGDELLPWIEAVLRLFATYGNYDMSPAGRRHARLKHLIADRGFEWFRQEACRVRGTLATTEPIDIPEPETTDRSAPARIGSANVQNHVAYRRWYAHATRAQRQRGFRACTIRAAEGNLQLEQARLVADLSRRYGDGTIRLTDAQDILLRWVRDENVAHLYAELRGGCHGFAVLRSPADIVACPGADTCPIGITSSKGLAADLRALFDSQPDLITGDTQTGPIRIRVSGCPNGCGQHHVGTIGFHGGTQTLGFNGSARQIPVAVLLVGGRLDRTGATFARRVAILPARRAAAAVEVLISLYRRERNRTESFEGWIGRTDTYTLRRALAALTVKDDDDPSLFRDSGQDSAFTFAGVGESECAK